MRRYGAGAGFAVMLLVGVLSASTQVVAEPYAVRLNGGVSGRQFWFYSGNVNPVYNTLARDAIANDWNVISNSRLPRRRTTTRLRSTSTRCITGLRTGRASRLIALPVAQESTTP